jgi:hypothetical protein
MPAQVRIYRPLDAGTYAKALDQPVQYMTLQGPTADGHKNTPMLHQRARADPLLKDLLQLFAHVHRVSFTVLSIPHGDPTRLKV